MCPYARFQSVMLDSDTLVVTYDETRGEPRALRRKGEDARATGKGDCIDCGICVQVCPTGVDIRKGLQYECIGCAVCIDACDQVMDKIGAPRGLVRFSTENALKKGWGRSEILAHVRRPRTLVYGAVLMAVCSAFVWGLATRVPLQVNVIRDRSSLGRQVQDGLIENVYQLRIMNMTEKPRAFVFTVKGLDGMRIEGEERIELNAVETRSVPLRVLAPASAGKTGANEIFFEISPKDEPGLQLREKTTFFFPVKQSVR
jgi:cytochrome c oxidase accessory protein FixG